MKRLKYILYLSLLSTIVLVGCSTKNPTVATKYEEPWMDRFFEYILFSQGGAYTLHGSKPMTYVEICTYPIEELLDLYQEFGIKIDENTPSVDLCGIVNGWEKWESFRKKSHFPRFIFSVKQDQEYPKLYHLYFINVAEAALVITENYAYFRKVLGFDFDPLQAIFEVDNGDSPFWKGVFNQADLIGVLYGYGMRNAQCFSWSYNEEHSERGIPKSFRESLVGSSVFLSQHIFNGREKVKDLKIPIFRSFQEDDPMIQKYRKERRKIQQLYAGKKTSVVVLETLLR